MGTADQIPERQERNIIPQQIRTMAGSDPSKTNNELGRSRTERRGPSAETECRTTDIEQLNQNNRIE